MDIFDDGKYWRILGGGGGGGGGLLLFMNCIERCFIMDTIGWVEHKRKKKKKKTFFFCQMMI